MNFQELGLTLQREREAKGLTIEAVMEATKISRINLLALESGDRSTLPHPVYTKGFIRSYARLLGLDADELTMVVDREYQSEEQEVDEISYDVSPAAGKAFQDSDVSVKRKKRSVWPSILIFLALAVAGVVLVLNLNKNADKPVSVSEPTTEQAASPVAQPADESPAVATSDGENGPIAEGQDSVSEVEVTSSGVQPDDEDNMAVQPAVIDDVESDVLQDGQEGVHYDHVLVIRATTDKGCWIGLWKGDESNMARDFVLKKGEPLRLMFNNPRRIRIGNVSGVEVTYNGEPYPLEQNKSNIQTLVFGAD